MPSALVPVLLPEREPDADRRAHDVHVPVREPGPDRHDLREAVYVHGTSHAERVARVRSPSAMETWRGSRGGLGRRPGSDPDGDRRLHAIVGPIRIDAPRP